MKKLIITGCGTDVGKTVTSAIVVTALKADYWKPVESGVSTHSDVGTMKQLTSACIHPCSYSLKAHFSPHHAARLENITIKSENISPPNTTNTLVIETVGGLMVPFNNQTIGFNLYKKWDAQWIVVSQNYLGSINHTLLTLEFLRQNSIRVAGIIFNGVPNPDSEQAILHFSHLPCLGRLFPEPEINKNVIERYSKEWKQPLHDILRQP